MNKKTIYTILKIIAGIYIAIILYLFALNGRYLLDHGCVLDKWKKEVILVKDLIKQ